MALRDEKGSKRKMINYASVPSLPTLFFDQAEKYGDAPFLWAKRNGAWQPTSWADVAQAVSDMAKSLTTLGIAPGDRVMLVSENRPEWMIADLAIMAMGAVSVPAYITNTVANHRHIINDSGAKAAFVSSKTLAKPLFEAGAGSSLETVITLDDGIEGSDGIAVYSWRSLIQSAKQRGDASSISAFARSLDRNGLATIIYTSGTGGEPAGVMLSHSNMLCNVMGADDFLRELEGFETGKEIFLSFLPLSHSYEHTVGQFVPISVGAQVYYAEGLDKLAANIAEVRPTIMTAVPRLYENLRGRILKGAEKAGGLKQKLLLQAIELGAKRYETPNGLSFFERMADKALDSLVRKKVSDRFGGRLKAFVSGGAPLNRDVGVFFTALGLQVLQGYGQTESAPVISVNRPHMNDMATVGPPLKGVDVKIADDGEILVRGELVMLGYWGQEERTASTIKDGWLHTGDIGELDSLGRIRITDRKKDIIVNSGGDNISPQRVEGILALEKEIGQVMVHGDKRPHLVALIVPDEDWATEWCQSTGETAGSDAYRKAISAAVDRANGGLAVIEKVRRFALADEEFSVENKMMTPSMKIRRHVIKANYLDQLESLYRHQ